jgi:hypothetical protein
VVEVAMASEGTTYTLVDGESLRRVRHVGEELELLARQPARGPARRPLPDEAVGS